jgi:hypothetical protein
MVTGAHFCWVACFGGRTAPLQGLPAEGAAGAEASFVVLGALAAASATLGTATVTLGAGGGAALEASEEA